MPAAVVGPPTFALDAINRSFRDMKRILPISKVNATWVASWMKMKRKREGADWMTEETLPVAPTVAKNTCKVERSVGIPENQSTMIIMLITESMSFRLKLSQPHYHTLVARKRSAHRSEPSKSTRANRPPTCSRIWATPSPTGT